MRPFFYSATTNFGDYLNSWLWDELVPELTAREDDIRLVGIGSILSRNLDLVEGHKVVFGTGSGYSEMPTREQAARWDVRCVRGPLTAHHMGLPDEKSITDGAWLIDGLPRFRDLAPARSGVAFVPHWTTQSFGNWSAVCRAAGLTYVNPFDPFETVARQLAGTDLAIVESLHGAIVADYYRTPWIPVTSPGRVLSYKWVDWCMSLDLEYRPYLLPLSDLFDHLFERRMPQPVPSSPVPFAVEAEGFHASPKSAGSVSPPSKARQLRARTMSRLKGTARQVRGAMLTGVGRVRETNLVALTGARRQEQLASYMTRLTTCRPTLSSNAVRTDRLDRLADALEAMRADYAD